MDNDVVRCGECKNKETDKCPRYNYDEVYNEWFGPQDACYCEKGVRKEVAK